MTDGAALRWAGYRLFSSIHAACTGVTRQSCAPVGSQHRAARQGAERARRSHDGEIQPGYRIAQVRRVDSTQNNVCAAIAVVVRARNPRSSRRDAEILADYFQADVVDAILDGMRRQSHKPDAAG
ncbi:hypothetical protein [Burkholderia sp. BCC0322]|uniref:hypothetical protein n=1 Tax=unclassified Burkholderia TaxID=2613784 RepID=UPI00158D9655|nr:hypothetical protein [Burkholderia sp. BCC0322]